MWRDRGSTCLLLQMAVLEDARVRWRGPWWCMCEHGGSASSTQAMTMLLWRWMQTRISVFWHSQGEGIKTQSAKSHENYTRHIYSIRLDILDDLDKCAHQCTFFFFRFTLVLIFNSVYYVPTTSRCHTRIPFKAFNLLLLFLGEKPQRASSSRVKRGSLFLVAVVPQISSSISETFLFIQAFKIFTWRPCQQESIEPANKCLKAEPWGTPYWIFKLQGCHYKSLPVCQVRFKQENLFLSKSIVFSSLSMSVVLFH